MSKRALLVGCNYPGTDLFMSEKGIVDIDVSMKESDEQSAVRTGTSAKLRGCINDVKSMYALLTECYGFNPQNISVLVDDGTSPQSPTGANIKKYLTGLVQASQPGDIAVFHFSGHGTQIRDKDGAEHDNKDEAIVPTDMNLICDDDLRLILNNMAQGVHFTMISDCCHSGSMLDHPQQQISGNKDPNAPPGVDAMNPMDILGMFFREAPGGARDFDFGSHDQDVNRGLPENRFCQILGEKFGTSVLPGQIHSMLTRSFGNAASAKSLNYLGLLQQGLEALQAMGAGTREFPPSDINHGTRDFPPPGENANPAANPGGTQATTRDTTTRSSSGSMQCILMVVKALIKMKTKPSNQSGYGNSGYGGYGGGGGGGMWGASQQQQYHQNSGYGGQSGYGGNSGYGGGGGGLFGGGMFGGSSQNQGGYGGQSGYGGNSGYGGGGGGMWGSPPQQQHHSSGYGGQSGYGGTSSSYGGMGGSGGAGGLLGALMGGLSGVNNKPPTTGGGYGGGTGGYGGGGYGGTQGGYGGAQGGYGGAPGGESRDARGVLITGCQDHETSADACPSGDPSKAFGALTNALVTSVRAVKRNNPNATPTYKQLVQDVRSVMLHAKYKQNPCLECDNQHVDAPFIC